MNRSKVVVVLLSSILVVGAAVAKAVSGDPYAPVVTLVVTPPSGPAQTFTPHESDTVMLKVGNVEYNFRPNILDAKPWTKVDVYIFKGATASAPDSVLGDIEVTTGGPAVTSKTSPAFKIQVTKVEAGKGPEKK